MNTTTSNIEFLTKIGACVDAISFVKRNNLENFPLSRLGDIRGDECSYKSWILHKIKNSTYDDNGNELTFVNSKCYAETKTYDDKGNQLTSVDPNGYYWTKTYDDKSNEITYVDSSGYYWTKTYDDKGNQLTSVYSDGSSWTKTYEYHLTGQLKSVHTGGKLTLEIPLI